MKDKQLTFVGGTGASIIGKASKRNKNWNVCLLVSLVDDGGSTGRLRKDLKLAPVGDIRKAITSLSTLDNSMIDAFEHRFDKGDLQGHTMGNVFLAGLILNSKNINEGIKNAEKLLQVKGKVLTATLEMTTLITRFENGKTINGEDNLDENRETRYGNPISYSLKTQKKANPLSVEQIRNSDLITIGPGDLGANSIAPLLTNEIQQALRETKAKLLYIGNLMTKCGETHSMNINQCAHFIENTFGRKFDYVLVNKTKPPAHAINRYKKANEFCMSYDPSDFKQKKIKLVEADLLNEKIYEKPKADMLRRSFLRHDGKKIVEILEKILNDKL